MAPEAKVNVWPWIIGGAVVLLIWSANQPSNDGTNSSADYSSAADGAFASAPEAETQAPPASVDDRSVAKAAQHYRLAIQSEGLAGAQVYSVNCYASLAREFAWQKLDQCAVFDTLTGLLVQSDASQAESGYFNDGMNASRYREAASASGAESDGLSKRLSLIKAAAVLQWGPVEPTPPPGVTPDEQEPAEAVPREIPTETVNSDGGAEQLDQDWLDRAVGKSGTRSLDKVPALRRIPPPTDTSSETM